MIVLSAKSFNFSITMSSLNLNELVSPNGSFSIGLKGGRDGSGAGRASRAAYACFFYLYGALLNFLI